MNNRFYQVFRLTTFILIPIVIFTVALPLKEYGVALSLNLVLALLTYIKEV